jgi:hypothetical protein
MQKTPKITKTRPKQPLTFILADGTTETLFAENDQQYFVQADGQDYLLNNATLPRLQKKGLVPNTELYQTNDGSLAFSKISVSVNAPGPQGPSFFDRFSSVDGVGGDVSRANYAGAIDAFDEILGRKKGSAATPPKL